MSIETLSTELDDTIIRRVGEAELSALSQTSKEVVQIRCLSSAI